MVVTLTDLVVLFHLLRTHFYVLTALIMLCQVNKGYTARDLRFVDQIRLFQVQTVN